MLCCGSHKSLNPGVFYRTLYQTYSFIELSLILNLCPACVNKRGCGAGDISV